MSAVLIAGQALTFQSLSSEGLLCFTDMLYLPRAVSQLIFDLNVKKPKHNDYNKTISSVHCLLSILLIHTVLSDTFNIVFGELLS